MGERRGMYRADEIDRKFRPKPLTGKNHMGEAEVDRIILKQTLKIGCGVDFSS
jgi:hypothetical protein